MSDTSLIPEDKADMPISEYQGFLLLALVSAELSARIQNRDNTGLEDLISILEQLRSTLRTLRYPTT